jgi:PEP-CTERM motif
MKRKFVASVGGAVLAIVVGAASAIADPLDPPLFVYSNSACQSAGGCPVFGTEVNGMGASSLILNDHQGGGGALDNPVLLILGVVNNSSFSAPSITLSSGTATLGGTAAYLGTWDSTTGFAGTFTSGSAQPVTDAIGLQDQGDASESFTNWHAAEQSVLNINATSFGLYVYTLTDTGLSGGGSVTVNFASALPLGTFVIGYGCDGASQGYPSDVACDPNGKVFGTPFTESGLVDSPSVPEPASIALLGTALFGMAFLLGRKKARS